MTVKGTTLRRIIIGLEVFLSLGALVGGAMLMLLPDGSGFGMPLSMLEHSGFSDFRTPGLILAIVNGVWPLVSAFAVQRRLPWATVSVVMTGVVLTGWIAVQVVLLRGFSVLHGVYLLLGLAIAALGVALQKLHSSS